MDALQHTRNERNLFLKRDRADRYYRDCLLSFLPSFSQHLGSNVHSLSRESTDSNKSFVGELATTTTVRAMKNNQTLLEIDAAIAVMEDSK